MYPVALELTGKTCVVVGGGQVATRKIAELLENGAVIVVVSPAVTPRLQTLATQHHLRWITQPYQPGSLITYSPFIVIAATDQPEVNRQVADDARAIGALVNVADGHAASDFHTMTSIHHAPLTVSVHTGGASPALARHLLTVVDQAVGDEYPILAGWLGVLRPQIKRQITPQSRRSAFYEAVLHSDALILLRQGKTDSAYERVQNLVQEWTCGH